MKKVSLSIILLFLIPYSSWSQISCSDVATIAAAVDITAPGFDMDVYNYEYAGGTCGTITYNGQEINGSSTFNFNVNVAVGLDEVVCGGIDGDPPSITDIVSIEPSFKCEFNIMNVTGYLEVFAVKADKTVPIEIGPLQPLPVFVLITINQNHDYPKNLIHPVQTTGHSNTQSG